MSFFSDDCERRGRGDAMLYGQLVGGVHLRRFYLRVPGVVAGTQQWHHQL